MTGERFWHRNKYVRAVKALVGHVVFCTFFLLGLKWLEYLISFLWPGAEPTLFGIPIKAMLHASDFAIIAIFLGWSVLDIWMILRE
jgi:hypothetical protein